MRDLLVSRCDQVAARPSGEVTDDTRLHVHSRLHYQIILPQSCEPRAAVSGRLRKNITAEGVDRGGSTRLLIQELENQHLFHRGRTPLRASLVTRAPARHRLMRTVREDPALDRGRLGTPSASHSWDPVSTGQSFDNLTKIISGSVGGLEHS